MRSGIWKELTRDKAQKSVVHPKQRGINLESDAYFFFVGIYFVDGKDFVIMVGSFSSELCRLYHAQQLQWNFWLQPISQLSHTSTSFLLFVRLLYYVVSLTVDDQLLGRNLAE